MKLLKTDFYPYIIPTLLTALYAWKVKAIHAFILACGIKIDVIFTGFFNISAILSGLLFTIFCFIAVSSNPFIGKVQKTQTYADIKSFVFRTTLISLLSALFSLLLSSIDMNLEQTSFYVRSVLYAWVFVSTANIAYFLTCLHHFMLLSNDVPPQRISGG